jgi:ketosteroid isomerase-like protein
MSQENVEIVEMAYAAIERGDLGAIFQLHGPEIECQMTAEDPDAAIHRGRDAVWHYFGEWFESFPGLSVELEECFEIPDGRVFATVRYTAQARADDFLLEWRQSHIYTVQEGKVVRAVEYFDRDQALEAVGLRE